MMPARTLRFPEPCQLLAAVGIARMYRSVLPAAGGPPSRRTCKAFAADALRNRSRTPPLPAGLPTWRGSVLQMPVGVAGGRESAIRCEPALSGAAFRGHCSALRPGSRAPAVSALPGGAARSCGYLGKTKEEQRSLPRQRPGGRYH